jgi:hypothetical protein
MQPHRDRRPSTRRTVRTLHCTLVAALVLGAAVAAPRRAEAQLPVAAQVVAAVAQWMARWLGDYLLGRGVNVAMERVRGAAYRDQLANLEQVLRSQIRRGGANRSQLTRELKLVERQRRLVNGVLNPAFTRDSARVYYGRVNEDMDELREVVRAVTAGMDTAWATIDDMQRELDALRREVKGLRAPTSTTRKSNSATTRADSRAASLPACGSGSATSGRSPDSPSRRTPPRRRAR